MAPCRSDPPGHQGDWGSSVWADDQPAARGQQPSGLAQGPMTTSDNRRDHGWNGSRRARRPVGKSAHTAHLTRAMGDESDTRNAPLITQTDAPNGVRSL